MANTPRLETVSTKRQRIAELARHLSVHRSPAVRAAVETVGATLCFLPKYSLDLNPIECASRS